MNRFLDEFVRNKFVSPGKALDLGAGDFKDVRFLRNEGWVVEGVDKKYGTDLEKPYLSEVAPFNLVYSNYVLQRISDKEAFIRTAFDNLRDGGWIFIHTFDKSDKVLKSSLDKEILCSMLKNQGFRDIDVRSFDVRDDAPGHHHMHCVLQASARKFIDK